MSVLCTLIALSFCFPSGFRGTAANAAYAGNGIQMREDCQVTCGYYDQLCCAANQVCFTDSLDRAQCSSTAVTTITRTSLQTVFHNVSTGVTSFYDVPKTITHTAYDVTTSTHITTPRAIMQTSYDVVTPTHVTTPSSLPPSLTSLSSTTASEVGGASHSLTSTVSANGTDAGSDQHHPSTGLKIGLAVVSVAGALALVMLVAWMYLMRRGCFRRREASRNNGDEGDDGQPQGYAEQIDEPAMAMLRQNSAAYPAGTPRRPGDQNPWDFERSSRQPSNDADRAQDISMDSHPYPTPGAQAFAAPYQQLYEPNAESSWQQTRSTAANMPRTGPRRQHRGPYGIDVGPPSYDGINPVSTPPLRHSRTLKGNFPRSQGSMRAHMEDVHEEH